jgi:hypothetical protein
MIRWLLYAAIAFLVIAALQGVMASRRTKAGGGPGPCPLPRCLMRRSLKIPRRELEALEQRLDIQQTGQQGKERNHVLFPD